MDWLATKEREVLKEPRDLIEKTDELSFWVINMLLMVKVKVLFDDAVHVD